MRDYARTAGVVFVDFHAAVVDAEGMLRDGLSTDGVHPTDAGYAVMAPLARDGLLELAAEVNPLALRWGR